MLETVYYNVYKTGSGLYMTEEDCAAYNVGDKEQEKNIKGITCYKVSEKEIEYLNTLFDEAQRKLVPNFIKIFDLQLVLSFTVYVDKKHDNKLYILNSLCSKYNILPEAKRIIEGTTYCNVSEEDVTRIEEETKEENIILKRKYVDITLDDEIKPAQFLFVYYYDYDTKKSYIRRDMYDLITKNGIEIEGCPKVINNKNCYSITENELKSVEIQMGYRGIEQLLKPKLQIEVSVKDEVMPYDDRLSTVVEEPMPYKDSLSTISEEKVMPYQDHLSTVVETPMPYNDRLSTVSEEVMPYQDRLSTIIEIPMPYLDHLSTVQDSEEDYVLVYRDKRTNQLFVPTSLVSERDQQATIIMHKPCYEIFAYELDEIRDKRIIIVSVYPIEKKEYNIIICNNNGQLFVSRDILEELGFYIEDPHKILVNKQVYEEITVDDIELIQDKESDSCHINIIMKQIAPKRG